MERTNGYQGKQAKQSKQDQDSMHLDKVEFRRSLTKGRVWGAEFDSYEVQ
jgi:hypothetical protein